MYRFLWCSCILLFSLFLSAAPHTKDSLVLKLAQVSSDEEKIQILEQLAANYDEHGMNVSVDYARELISLLEKQPDDIHTAINYANAAIIFLDCNVFDKSLELLLKALKIFEREGDLRSITVLKNTMGGVYLRLGRTEQALAYFKEGLEGAEKLVAQGDSSCMSLLHVFYNNIGLIYSESEDKNVLAGTYFEKALELMDSRDYMNMGQCYNNMAVFMLRRKNYDKALYCAKESMKYRELAGDGLGIARTSCTMARIFMERKDYAGAWPYLTKAENIAEDINSDLLLRDIYSLWVEMTDYRKDFRLKSDYLIKQLEVQENLMRKQMLEKTTALEMEYNFEKKLADHQLLIEKERYRSRIFLLLAVLVILLGALFYLLILIRNWRIKEEKKALEVNLETKNKELTTNVMYLMKNTEMVKNIITRLGVLRPNMKAENARVIKDIIKDLEASLKDDSWNEFETHFNNVHIDFYKKLQNYCPELTPTELKMCAFLRLNMSSKEISSISGITVKSVDVMRGRIRKKLNIANTEVNLISFLSGF